ncbi:SigE family RNA polymerase sigma factor [Longispora albida]|uniref:SigE family RNA polymerase sigma factor n=1 Tax=Longispora albida TaxID=203523 RepID=UPI000361E774|nr:SigE family RNA polymerase sigma factor [Longispora albida]
MSGNVQFEEFVGACSPRLLRLGYVLTRDHALAEDLLQTSLAKSWPVWQKISADPEPYVRKVMANTFTTWWRRRWNGEQPASELPDTATPAQQATVDDRDEVWRALARLPRQQRAVLALRYLEDLTEAQIAETLGISPGAVKNYASKALAKLRLDPTLRPDLPEIPDAPPGTQRLAGVQSRVRRRRTTRLVTAGAACLAILLLITAYLLIPGTRSVSLPPADEYPPADVGFPAVRNGYRLLKSESDSFAAREIGFTWTPATLDAEIYPYCELQEEVTRPLFCVVTVNGRLHSPSTMRMPGEYEPARGSRNVHQPHTIGDVQRYRLIDETANPPFALEVGKPVRISLRLVHSENLLAPLPDNWVQPRGWMAIAVAVR